MSIVKANYHVSFQAVVIADPASTVFSESSIVPF